MTAYSLGIGEKIDSGWPSGSIPAQRAPAIVFLAELTAARGDSRVVHGKGHGR